MKEVKTQKRYKCDFCKRRSTKSAMEAHEIICFRNPNRVCSLCENNPRGVLVMNGEEYGGSDYYEPCIYCSQFNPKKKEEIEKYEREKNPPVENIISKEEVPF